VAGHVHTFRKGGGGEIPVDAGRGKEIGRSQKEIVVMSTNELAKGDVCRRRKRGRANSDQEEGTHYLY